jgi:hypothetical protein
MHRFKFFFFELILPLLSSFSLMFRFKRTLPTAFLIATKTEKCFYNTTADNADGRRIVEILRRQYEQKKLQHMNAAEKDRATILSMNSSLHLPHHGHESLKDYEDSTFKSDGIYGLGYTSPKEV